MKPITLYGAGGHCYAVVELIRSLGEFDPVLIIDDNPNVGSIFDIPVQPNQPEQINEYLCVTIGNNVIRKRIVERQKSIYPNFVHDSVVSYPSVTIGEGSVILPNAVLDAGVEINKHCIVNLNATVSHNTIVNDFCHIAIQAAVAGGVQLGEGVLVGAGSVILPEISIGKWATIGAGAVVTKDVPDYAVVVGNPATIIRYNPITNE
ncbi:MAG: acetyltransferase [Flavobacteriaceae bacterium]|nr:acetyltransferase [Flavobacteriaceae bacterium]